MDSFQRNISMNFDKKGDHAILIKTRLVDVFHDIVLDVLVDYENMAIRNIEANFIKAPTPDCSKVKERLALLIGTTISKGLTKKLFQALGGNRGCTNLRNMLLCSLPIALNFRAVEGIENEDDMLNIFYEKLTDTCIGYAKPINKD